MYAFVKRLVLGLTFMAMPALAQQHGHPMMGRSDSTRGMMQGSMMGMMMQNPLHRATMMAFVLPAMADTLSLSEQQQNQLRALKQRMLEGHRARQQEIRQHQQALQSLFQNEQQPDPAALREHLQAMAQLEADDRLAPYETFRQMLQVLNDAQRERLRGIQPHQLMAYMMRLPMMEMMPMMHMMHGHAGMIQMMPGVMPMHHHHEEQHEQGGHHHHHHY